MMTNQFMSNSMLREPHKGIQTCTATAGSNVCLRKPETHQSQVMYISPMDLFYKLLVQHETSCTAKTLYNEISSKMNEE